MNQNALLLALISGLSICPGKLLHAQQQSSGVSGPLILTSTVSILEPQEDLSTEGQESGESVLSSEEGYTSLDTGKDDASTDARVLIGSVPNEEGLELIQQFYANGNPKVNRFVKLDAEGNYVNHGAYHEWSEAGELLVHGEYKEGLQHGIWTRTCTSKHSKIFESEPYSHFKPPFQSTAEFKDGKLNGVWTITDKENRKVSEIQLRDGRRHGGTIFMHPNGVVLWQGEYQNGLLHGSFIEKDMNGKLVRQTEYTQGQKQRMVSTSYPNKKTKQEYQVLSPAQTVVQLDDWNSSQLATYQAAGDEIKHGVYRAFFENGALRLQSTYERGVLSGDFAVWYSNGQREIAGSYSSGEQHGKWNWWHDNGMHKATATFDQGVLVGSAMAWNADGKRLEASDLAEVPAPQSISESTEEKSSRSALKALRPVKK